MKRRVLFECEVCHELYPKAKRAQDCEAATEQPRLKVGDIVTCGSGFGWYDGNEKWVSNPGVRKNYSKPRIPCPSGHGNCFSPCCTFRFYYVVTKIDRETKKMVGGNPHRVRYHLATKAMSGLQGFGRGYTFFKTHCDPVLVPDPPEDVVKDSQGLIGQEAGTLI